MKLNADNTLTLETITCWHCMGWRDKLPAGHVAGRKTCPTCNGTRRGKRGKVNACKDCFSGMVVDPTKAVVCEGCNGTTIIPETDTDYASAEFMQQVFKLAPITVTTQNRGQSFNETYIGLGLFYGCTDYGRANDAYKTNPQAFVASLPDMLAKERHQYSSFTKTDKTTGIITLCSAFVAVITNDGMNIRPVFNTVAATLKQARAEPSVEAGMALGTVVYNAGGNGTLAAVLGLPR